MGIRVLLSLAILVFAFAVIFRPSLQARLRCGKVFLLVLQYFSFSALCPLSVCLKVCRLRSLLLQGCLRKIVGILRGQRKLAMCYLQTKDATCLVSWLDGRCV